MGSGAAEVHVEDRLYAVAHGVCALFPACFPHPWSEENLKLGSELEKVALCGEPLGSYTTLFWMGKKALQFQLQKHASVRGLTNL